VWIFDLPKNIEKGEVLIVSFDVEWNIESVAGHTFENVSDYKFGYGVKYQWQVPALFRYGFPIWIRSMFDKIV
jgi:hypothetical protein